MKQSNSSIATSDAINNSDLVDLISGYNFMPYGIRGTKWYLLINNSSNCQSKVFIFSLNDNETIRVSVSNEDEEYINAVDMFEAKDMDKIRRFIDLLIL